MGEQKVVYNLDGTESKNPLTFNGNTIERSSKVKWDGAKLVITTTTNFNGTANESTQTWSLDASGQFARRVDDELRRQRANDDEDDL